MRFKQRETQQTLTELSDSFRKINALVFGVKFNQELGEMSGELRPCNVPPPQAWPLSKLPRDTALLLKPPVSGQVP